MKKKTGGRFRIYQVDPYFRRWGWQCTYCDPPANGSRWDWEDIIAISLPKHFQRRAQHHQYVARHRISPGVKGSSIRLK